MFKLIGGAFVLFWVMALISVVAVMVAAGATTAWTVNAMARAVRGPYSPQSGRDGGNRPVTPAPQPNGPQTPRHPYMWRTTALTLAAAPLLIGAFTGDPAQMALKLAGFGIFAGAMFLTREGLVAEAAYNARRVARRPGIPRKLFGMVLTGLGLAVASWVPGASPAGPLIIGVVAGALHWLGFGPDPMRDKGMEGIDTVQQDRVQRVVDEGEAYLKAMSDAILRLRDRGLEARVAHFAGTARELFRRVQDDPAALAAARRYLGVYLMGARDATIKFVDHFEATRDPSARAEYEALLADLETNFAARSRAILEGGRADLDIEVQVLRERLAREGVRTPAAPPGAAGEGAAPVLPADTTPEAASVVLTREQRLDDLIAEARLTQAARRDEG